MNNQDIPKNISEGFENYKIEILKANILVRTSKDLLFKILDPKNKIKDTGSHAVAIAELIKNAIEILIQSSFISNKEVFSIPEDKTNLITQVEKLNPEWLPKFTEKIVLQSDKGIDISEKEITENYTYLLNTLSQEQVQNLNANELENILNKINLIINNISKIINSHKVLLYKETYVYIIEFEKDVVIGHIDIT